MNGWRLWGVLALLVGAMALLLGSSHGWDVEGLRLAIRATARTSLVLFLLAFTAGALARTLPSAFTRWQRRNRRYLGVAFATSHLFHLVGLIALARVDRDLFWRLTNPFNVTVSGTGYVLIALMAVTSFDRTAAALGPVRWRRLHLVGSWYIWLIFALGTGRRLAEGPIYGVMFVLVICAAGVRLIAMQGRNRALRLEAPT